MDSNRRTQNIFFSPHAKEIPRILWDAIRNGTHHMFIPKEIRRARKKVQFMFYVDPSTTKSNVTESGNTIKININSIEFYHVFKEALEDYKTELTTDPNIQTNFMKAWKSVKPRLINTRSSLSPEIDYLSNQLKKTGKFSLFF